MTASFNAAFSPAPLIPALSPTPAAALFDAALSPSPAAALFDTTISPASLSAVSFDAALSPAHAAVTRICPCCGREGRLVKRIDLGVFAVVVSANREFDAHLEAAGIKFVNGGSTIMMWGP